MNKFAHIINQSPEIIEVDLGNGRYVYIQDKHYAYYWKLPDYYGQKKASIQKINNIEPGILKKSRSIIKVSSRKPFYRLLWEIPYGTIVVPRLMRASLMVLYREYSINDYVYQLNNDTAILLDNYFNHREVMKEYEITSVKKMIARVKQCMLDIDSDGIIYGRLDLIKE